ncbi:hypothetical protein WME90_00710 [Sorangium sp. So ce375]|uniref:hypothetical protein n=1 Tax=Sorangium sp. So ce375 TaxID=3133306 RepID=UPI003F5BCA1D
MRPRRRHHALALAALAASAGIAGCSRWPSEGPSAARQDVRRAEGQPSAAPPSPAASGGFVAGGPQPAAAPQGTPPQARPLLLLTDPAVLAELEAAGLDFGSVLTGAPRAPAALSALSRTAELASIARVLADDLRQVQRADPRSGTTIARHAHRLFDERWLSAEGARFELIGVVNRMDRRPFHASACGETRLVYRLAYAAKTAGGAAGAPAAMPAPAATSRLPMTASFELLAPAGDALSCRRLAQAWSRAAELSGPALARWLTSSDGPLARPATDRANLARLVVNLQSVRWPSTVRPDLGGHAEYVLRAFRWDARAGRYAPLALENTPDVARLSRDRAQRERLRAWLSAPENLARLDNGTALLPEEFLATKALSATPHGLARRANRPFRVLFEPRDFAGLDFGRLSRVRSPEGLLRRLDQMTCPGCHQSGSVAGFHLLGQEPPGRVHDALFTVESAHLAGDLPRRRAVVEAIARGAAPDYEVPYPERGDGTRGGYGARCGLGDPSFADWGCGEGLVCSAYDAPLEDRATVGVCLPATPEVGDPCQVGAVVAHADPHRDRASPPQEGACPLAAVCNTSPVGFPGGMCTGSCVGLPEEGVCGAIAVLDPFNRCLARGTVFTECLSRHVTPAGLRRCSGEAPCREDYVCARTSSGEGACIPPYFLFQLRVDGHAVP